MKTKELETVETADGTLFVFPSGKRVLMTTAQMTELRCRVGFGLAWRILLLVVAMMVAAILISSGGEVPLRWDASVTPGVTNYVLYASTNSLAGTNLSSAPVRVNVGTNLTATVLDLSPGVWQFAVTANKNGIQSDPSAVLILDSPQAPSNLRSVVLQYSATLTNGFQDLLFLKLRVP